MRWMPPLLPSTRKAKRPHGRNNENDMAGSHGERLPEHGFVLIGKGPRSVRVRLTAATRSLGIEKQA